MGRKLWSMWGLIRIKCELMWIKKVMLVIKIENLGRGWVGGGGGGDDQRWWWRG